MTQYFFLKLQAAHGRSLVFRFGGLTVSSPLPRSLPFPLPPLPRALGLGFLALGLGFLPSLLPLHGFPGLFTDTSSISVFSLYSSCSPRLVFRAVD